MRIHKIGGFASIVLGCILAIYVALLLLGVFQSVGWEDPVKALEAAAGTSPVTQFISHLLGVIGSITVVLIVLAVRDRMANMAPNLMRIVVIGGSVGGALWLTARMTETVSLPAILNAKDASAYMGVMALNDGLLGASEFALG